MPIVRKGKRNPLWVHTVEGIIWQVVPTGRGVLICETRDLEAKMTRFAGVNQTNGRGMWRNSSFGEQWWLGVETVCGGVLLLHKFAQPDMPEHRGLIAVDVESGRQLWQNDDVKFEGADGDSLFASRRGLAGEQFFQFDVRSGDALQAVTPSAMQREIPVGETEKRLFPIPLMNLQMEHSTIGARILPHCNIEKVVGAVEYVELGDALAFSVHERGSSSTPEQLLLDHRLVILSNSDIIFSDIITRNAPASVPDSFFVENDVLFFVQERTKLTAVHL